MRLFSNFMDKRGMASATEGAATIIIIIGLLITAYIILIPENAREDVLEGREIDYGDFTDGDNDDSIDSNKDKIILLRNPGELLPTGRDDVKKSFASVNLFRTSEKESKKLADVVIVSRSAFSNDFKDLEFTINNVESLGGLSLFFNIKKAEGNIEIGLNGKIVFEGRLDSSDIPIDLPVVNLRERNNLRISGAGVGAAFLSSNKFELKDVELIFDYNLENKVESRSFEITRAEAVDNAVLEFFVNCVEIGNNQGILQVQLNRKNIFFGRVVCDASQTRFDVDEDLFVDGTNRLVFSVDKGNYILEEVELKYDFDEGITPLYFFTINEEDFEDIVDNDDKVKLIMLFDNNDDRKRADVRINDDTVFVDVNSGRYDKDITEFVREGENFIKIFPRNEFNLIQLEIRLERD